MPVPASINDLSTTAGNNSPAGSESPTTTDDYLRAHASFIATVRDSASTAQASADAAYRKSNILGTVSQDAGVPTGAIIERSSNANGEYVRYADGTQRCRFLQGGTGRVTWTFPAPFIAAPIVEATPVIDATGSAHGAHVLTVGLNSAEHYGWLQNGATTNLGTNTQRSLIAEGRWFN